MSDAGLLSDAGLIDPALSLQYLLRVALSLNLLRPGVPNCPLRALKL